MNPALDTLRSALESVDPTRLLALLAEDVQLHSPALIGPEYRGRDLVASIVLPAMHVLTEPRITDILEADDGQTGGLLYDARVGDAPAQAFVMLRTAGDHIREITLLIRPLAALQAFVAKMAELGAKPALDARRAEPRE